MKKLLSSAAIVIGTGLIVFGLAGFQGQESERRFSSAGWPANSQTAMAIGAMFTVGGWLARR